MGTHTHPSSGHLGSLAWCFLASVTWAAALANTPASKGVRGLSGEGIETSSDAVLPKNQLGSKMSAGRDLLWSRVRLLLHLDPYVCSMTGFHQDVPNLVVVGDHIATILA